jgi:hypothetical protein
LYTVFLVGSSRDILVEEAEVAQGVLEDMIYVE